MQGMFQGQKNAIWLAGKSAAARAARIHHCGSRGKNAAQSLGGACLFLFEACAVTTCKFCFFSMFE